jgi:hypothetical protein
LQHKNFAFDCREAAFYLMFTLATVLAQDLLMQVADAWMALMVMGCRTYDRTSVFQWESPATIYSRTTHGRMRSFSR